MRPCSRVGLDITWHCNCKCRHCFYLRDKRLNRGEVPPYEDLEAKIRLSLIGGLDHAVMVGYGEPSLSPVLPRLLDHCHENGMATSMITNGATGLKRFQGYARQGMDHLHISSHGLDGTLDDIMNSPGLFRKQAELKAWLGSEGIPFRTNVTLQTGNYREVPDLAEYEISHGVFHFVILGFLPHYEWHDHVAEIAVHPATLRPYIEGAAHALLEAGTYFTIRYHPLCQLSEEFWPYVVNARYVPYDPFEWQYCLTIDPVSVEEQAVNLGEQVKIRGGTCDRCCASQWCGGWNKTYAAAFPGCVSAIEEMPERYRSIDGQYGAMHDLNPVNHLSGTIGRGE